MGPVQKEDSCSFPHSHASENPETSVEGAKNTGVSSLKPAVDNERRRKGKLQASSSVPTGKRQTDDKRSKSLEARPATRAQIPCLWERDVEKRRVIIGILPCVVITSLQTGASMATIACIDMLMVRRNPARCRKVRVLKEQLRFCKKKCLRLCGSKFKSKEVYFAESWANEIERFGGTRS